MSTILLQTGVMSDQATIALFALFGIVLFGSFGFTWGIHQSESTDRDDLHDKLSDLTARMDVHERQLDVWNKVMEARVLASFTNPNPVTADEAALIRRVHQHGVNSALITDNELLSVIKVLDREYDAGEIPPVKRPDAHLALALLNAGYERRQATRESQTIRTVAPRRKPWWRFW